ncbi:type II toxin-antitoxin system HicB family antitoxin [Acinetobacter sp. VNK23]|uniref:type II toxin-antitoxin system HicB family antitoxin n=1 Tax=Acinetobacter thutiue TaxID=2998078 RepID=UPI0025760361|nr:type II toxin-antitoxin system HicB family antitoxin [Acinetobacter thutiue]MDM1021864.1 type II toxin-antitoxin system HicB family antitoxin [Acinetobacter thutiue]
MKNYTLLVKVTESKGFFKKNVYEATLFEHPKVIAIGSSYDEAVNKIQEKIHEYFDFLSDSGEDIPEPAEMTSIMFKNRDKNVFFHVISIDTSVYSEKTEKINVTMPISLTRKVDDFLKDKVHNTNLFSSRSDFITKACKQYLPFAQNLAAIFNNEKNFSALRYKEGNTTDNCCNLLEYLNNIYCNEVILFATYRTASHGYSHDDGPETNLPLMGAIVKLNLPALRDIYIIFDGLFLTAQRKPRYNEIKEVLDTAVLTNKTSFIRHAVPFTSQLDSVEAVKLLGEFPQNKLTQDSRSEFFNLLSNISEAEYINF